MVVNVSFLFRPVREGIADVPGQARQEEEDVRQEVHPQPRLQRSAGLRRARGEHRGRHALRKGHRLRQVREHIK